MQAYRLKLAWQSEERVYPKAPGIVVWAKQIDPVVDPMGRSRVHTPNQRAPEIPRIPGAWIGSGGRIQHVGSRGEGPRGLAAVRGLAGARSERVSAVWPVAVRLAA